MSRHWSPGSTDGFEDGSADVRSVSSVVFLLLSGRESLYWSQRRGEHSNRLTSVHSCGSTFSDPAVPGQEPPVHGPVVTPGATITFFSPTNDPLSG